MLCYCYGSVSDHFGPSALVNLDLCNGSSVCKLSLHHQNSQYSTPGRSAISFYYVNATSLAKTNAVQQLHRSTDIVEYDIDVALVAETWFTVKHSDKDIEIDQYNLFRRDRVRRKGGGVCAYVRAHYICQIFYPTVNHHLIEILWLKIDIGHALYFVACAYHPLNPKYPPVDFLTELINGIHSVISSYPSSTIVIAGDFNQLDTSRLNTDYGLLQIVTTHTHNLNLIDKAFVNQPDIYELIPHCIQSLVKTKHMAVLIHSVRCLLS